MSRAQEPGAGTSGAEPGLTLDDAWQMLNALALPLYAVEEGFRLQALNAKAESRLQERAERHAALFPDRPPLFEGSPRGGLCYELLYGRSSPCPYCPAVSETDRAALRERPLEKLIQWRDAGAGEERSLRLTFTHTASDGTMLVETVEDVTRQQQNQEEILRKENLAALGIMISGIAHELNNPLTGMGLNLQNLEANLGAMERDEILKRIGILRKDLFQASRIVSDILSFSRPGNLRVAMADIMQAIEKAAAKTQRLYPVLSRQTRWMIEGESLVFPFDTEKIERLFINLFRNSIQALDYAPGYIRVEVRRARAHARLIIEDNAGGIEAEHLGDVFKPFYSRSREARGSGLGLSICHGIVREHEGRIHVRSGAGKTRFYIALPLSPPQES